MVEGLAEAGEGPEQALGEEDEGAVDADIEAAVGCLHAAEEEGGGEADQDDDADEGDEGGADGDGAAVALQVGFAVLAEAIAFEGLGGEAFDGGDAAEVVGEAGAEEANFLADVTVEGGEFALEEDGAPEDEGHGEHGHPGDSGGEDEKCRADDEDGGGDLDDVVGTFVEEAFQLVDVVVEDGEQAAGAALFEKFEVEGLQVAVGVEAEGVLYLLGEVAPEGGVGVFEYRFQPPDDEAGKGEE